MKRILVLSDSHGNVNNMVTAVGRLHPDMIIHLGDCWADAEQLHRKFPMTVMEQVPGNCDCRQEVQERILLIIWDSAGGRIKQYDRNGCDLSGRK